MSEIRLYDIQKDYVFKRVFGQEKSKNVLISLLNAILRGNPKIEDITLMNTEVPKIFEDNKNIRLDVRAKISDGTFVQIEIQSQDTGEIPERALQSLANIMAENTYAGTPSSRKREELEKDLKSYIYPKVIGIWILGANVTTRNGAIHESCMTYQPTSVDGYEVMTDKARIIFIELLKARPKDLTRKNMLDMWLAFLQDPLRARGGEPVEEIEQAFETLQYLSADSQFRALAEGIENARKEQAVKERIAVEKALKEGLEVGFEKGIEKGLADGIEQGRAEERAKAEAEKIDMARNFLKMGGPIDKVAQGTGLSIAEIERIQD